MMLIYDMKCEVASPFMPYSVLFHFLSCIKLASVRGFFLSSSWWWCVVNGQRIFHSKLGFFSLKFISCLLIWCINCNLVECMNIFIQKMFLERIPPSWTEEHLYILNRTFSFHSAFLPNSYTFQHTYTPTKPPPVPDRYNM